MARTLGSVGVARRLFETDFFAYCDSHNFKPGAECARLLQQAGKAGDSRTFVQLLAVATKFIAPDNSGDIAPGQQTLIVDRSRDAAAA